MFLFFREKNVSTLAKVDAGPASTVVLRGATLAVLRTAVSLENIYVITIFFDNFVSHSILATFLLQYIAIFMIFWKLNASKLPSNFSTKKKNCQAVNHCLSLVIGFSGTAAMIGCLVEFFLVCMYV